MKPLSFRLFLHQNDVALTSFDLIYCLYQYQLRHTSIRTECSNQRCNCAHTEDERSSRCRNVYDVKLRASLGLRHTQEI